MGQDIKRVLRASQIDLPPVSREGPKTVSEFRENERGPALANRSRLRRDKGIIEPWRHSVIEPLSVLSH